MSTCLEPGNLLEIGTGLTRYATADIDGSPAELWVLHPHWLDRVGIESVERRLRLDFDRRPPRLAVAASRAARAGPAVVATIGNQFVAAPATDFGWRRTFIQR